MNWHCLHVDMRAWRAAMRRMGPVLIDRPAAVWLDAYMARYSFLYRCERLRFAAVDRRRELATVTDDMRRVAKVIRQSGGIHLRNDSAIHKALDDLERLGYITPKRRGTARYGWNLLPAGVLLAGAGEAVR